MDRPKRNALAGPGLPDEATLEILARAPFRSVCRSKCVAKAWRDLIADPLNRGRLPQTLQGFFSIFYRMGNLGHSFLKYSTTSVPLDIDPCLSFLTKLPEIEWLSFQDSCNGLLLFKHCQKSKPYEVLNYIVCNPTTKHWGAVPVCARCPPPTALPIVHTYLVFDPARDVSPHFHLIQFWKGGQDEEWKKINMFPLSVHTYSSETGVWSHSQTDWNEQGQLEGWRRHGSLKYRWDQRTFINGILHLWVKDYRRMEIEIVAVDVQGRTKRTIKMPAAAQEKQDRTSHIGQSQGRLHYMKLDFDVPGHVFWHWSKGVSIWVLQDYDTQEWVLKDTVSFLSLFGRMSVSMGDFRIVDIHPDRNVVFFLHPLNRLIAYDMDSKEVSVVSMLSESLSEIVPYIPYFSESPALTNKN